MDSSIPHVRSWLDESAADPRPWLLLGKGPSFAQLDSLSTSRYRLFGLNHVARELPVEVAHAIDIEVIAAAGDAIRAHAEALFMPWQPHERNRVGSRTLEQWCDEFDDLAALARAGRLFTYDLSSGTPRGDGPVIGARYFSAEAALELLAVHGASKVRSLGIDGGSKYAAAFTDLADKTLLASGHASFDSQFEAIARTIWKHDLDYAPAQAESPIRVFIGADPTQRLAARVLQHSIVRRTPRTVRFESFPDREFAMPRDPANRPRTGFSFQRLMIPEACDHAGGAIYLDADMLVFRDLSELWKWPLEGGWLAAASTGEGATRARQFSVLRMDCARLDWDIDRIVEGLDRGAFSYEQLIHECCLVPGDRVAELPPTWNSLESYEDGATRLLHYTDQHRQPWVYGRNPLGHLWYAALRDALDDGYLNLEEVHDEVQRGNVAPALPRWAQIPDVPDGTGRMRDWTPPYRRAMTGLQRLKASLPGPVRSRAGWLLHKVRGQLGR